MSLQKTQHSSSAQPKLTVVGGKMRQKKQNNNTESIILKHYHNMIYNNNQNLICRVVVTLTWTYLEYTHSRRRGWDLSEFQVVVTLFLPIFGAKWYKSQHSKFPTQQQTLSDFLAGEIFLMVTFLSLFLTGQISFTFCLIPFKGGLSFDESSGVKAMKVHSEYLIQTSAVMSWQTLKMHLRTSCLMHLEEFAFILNYHLVIITPARRHH